MKTALILAILSSILLDRVHGRGYMIHPPGRASRWRQGFDGPVYERDNSLNCGGFIRQWGSHGGKCGVCGDEYGIDNPKFAYPGEFARDPPIVKTYQEGQRISVGIEVTEPKKGYFEFRVAPLVNQPITQEELDKHVLRKPKVPVYWNKIYGTHHYNMNLPTGLTCDHCVLQWRWIAAKDRFERRTPHTFVNCADIKIVPSKE